MDKGTELIARWKRVRETTNDAGELKELETQIDAFYENELLFTVEEMYKSGIIKDK